MALEHLVGGLLHPLGDSQDVGVLQGVQKIRPSIPHRVRHNVDLVLLGILQDGGVLNVVLTRVVDRKLVLQHLRLDGRDFEQLLELVGRVVRHSDGLDLPLRVQRLNSRPRELQLRWVLGGGVEHVEVDVVGAQGLQLLLEMLAGVGLVGVLPEIREFGGDEKLLALQPGVLDGLPQDLLVTKNLCGVQLAVADTQGPSDGLVALLPGELPGAEAHQRHLHPVAQGYKLVLGIPPLKRNIRGLVPEIHPDAPRLLHLNRRILPSEHVVIVVE
mmetsp:Transcript_26/g.66  ORF Transcript_26/g.66 Transcript_26/m.66 type:complete len:272 (-) Transcript_26:364-1179(-)